MGFSAIGECNCGQAAGHLAGNLAAQRDQIFATLDKDQNGGLSVDEISGTKRGDFLIDNFKDIDTNADGLMSADEGFAFFESLGVAGGGDRGGPPDGPPSFQISNASLQALINALLEETDEDQAQSTQKTADVASGLEENISLVAVAA